VAVLVLCVLLALTATLSTGPDAFTTATVDRGTAIPVGDDATGVLGIDTSASVSAGAATRLVTVTNRFDQSLATTVTLDTSGGSLENAHATLDPGESLTTTVTVDCASPPAAVSFTVTARAGGQVSTTLSRAVAVRTADCSASGPSFATVHIVDQSTPNRGAKATYFIQYTVDRPGTVTEVRVTVVNTDRNEEDTYVRDPSAGTVAFESGGQRLGEQYAVRIQLYTNQGPVPTARLELTDRADGNGTVYRNPS
jgi:hypothetical protein